MQPNALDAIRVFVNEDDVVESHLPHTTAAGNCHSTLRSTSRINHHVLRGKRAVAGVSWIQSSPCGPGTSDSKDGSRCGRYFVLYFASGMPCPRDDLLPAASCSRAASISALSGARRLEWNANDETGEVARSNDDERIAAGIANPDLSSSACAPEPRGKGDRPSRGLLEVARRVVHKNSRAPEVA